MTGVFAQNVIHFGRYLRARGLEVTPPTGMDLLRAARLLGLEDGRDIRHAFRALVVTRPDQLPVFESAFELFFGRGVRRPGDRLGIRVDVPVYYRDRAGARNEETRPRE